MNTLARHIEALLIRHNCVVIPNLGGFIAQFTPARYNEQEDAFVPPCRKVSFNSMLSINDGLLIERYIHQGNMTYTEASRYLARQVGMLKDYIAENGEFELIGVGVLAANGEGGYRFTPREGGLITPVTYALETVCISPLSKISDSVEEKEPVETLQNSNTYTVRFNKTVVNYLAAAIMAVMFYFLVVPGGIIPSENMTQASVLPTQVEHRIVHHRHVTIVKKHKSQKQKVVSAESVSVKDASVSTNSKEYVIVLASAVAERYAQSYIVELANNHNLEARIIENNGMRRIVTGHYSTEEEARSFLRTLTDKDCFADSWIMLNPC